MESDASQFTLIRVACLLSASFLTSVALAADLPVGWARSIYAPSFGLDDDRVVTNQSQFAALYQQWSPSVPFSLYFTRKGGDTKRKVVTFSGCGQFLNLPTSGIDIGWENALERARYFLQVSGCRAWKIMPGLSPSETSYIPDLTRAGKHGLAESERMSREVIAAAYQLRKNVDVDILTDLDLSEDWSVDCRIESECRYVVFDNGFETLLIDFVAKGDYDKDGIEDVLVRLLAPGDADKETFYIGLIFTRRTESGELELVGRF